MITILNKELIRLMGVSGGFFDSIFGRALTIYEVDLEEMSVEDSMENGSTGVSPYVTFAKALDRCSVRGLRLINLPTIALKEIYQALTKLNKRKWIPVYCESKDEEYVTKFNNFTMPEELQSILSNIHISELIDLYQQPRTLFDELNALPGELRVFFSIFSQLRDCEGLASPLTSTIMLYCYCYDMHAECIDALHVVGSKLPIAISTLLDYLKRRDLLTDENLKALIIEEKDSPGITPSNILSGIELAIKELEENYPNRIYLYRLEQTIFNCMLKFAKVPDCSFLMYYLATRLRLSHEDIFQRIPKLAQANFAILNFIIEKLITVFPGETLGSSLRENELLQGGTFNRELIDTVINLKTEVNFIEIKNFSTLVKNVHCNDYVALFNHYEYRDGICDALRQLEILEGYIINSYGVRELIYTNAKYAADLAEVIPILRDLRISNQNIAEVCLPTLCKNGLDILYIKDVLSYCAQSSVASNSQNQGVNQNVVEEKITLTEIPVSAASSAVTVASNPRPQNDLNGDIELILSLSPFRAEAIRRYHEYKDQAIPIGQFIQQPLKDIQLPPESKMELPDPCAMMILQYASLMAPTLFNSGNSIDTKLNTEVVQEIKSEMKSAPSYSS